MTSPEQRAATDHLLTTTRSVRKRLDLERAVDPQVILDCIDIAQQAPTGSNRQGWRFVVVTDPDKRRALADIYRRGAGDYFTAQQGQQADGQTERVRSSAVYLADVLDRVPVHVIPCIYGRLSAQLAPMASMFGSIMPATWSFMLALRSRGLGTVWTTLHLPLAHEAAQLLGIPENVTQIGLIPVAYYTGTDFRPVERPPAAEITFWDGWGVTR